MELTATHAKNRFGQVLDEAQKRPVFIEKSGRRHSVVLSIEQYDALVAAKQVVDESPALSPEAQRFYEQHKDWVDEQNARVEKYGIWNEEFRRW